MFAIHVSTAVTDSITGFLIPVLVALVTKSSATTFQKRLVLGVCSAITAVVATLATTGNAIVGWYSVFNLFLVGVMAIGSYYGWWKGGTAFELMRAKTANIGIGPKPVTPAPQDAGHASVGLLLNWLVSLFLACVFAWVVVLAWQALL